MCACRMPWAFHGDDADTAVWLMETCRGRQLVLSPVCYVFTTIYMRANPTLRHRNITLRPLLDIRHLVPRRAPLRPATTCRRGWVDVDLRVG